MEKKVWKWFPASCFLQKGDWYTQMSEEGWNLKESGTMVHLFTDELAERCVYQVGRMYSNAADKNAPFLKSLQRRNITVIDESERTGCAVFRKVNDGTPLELYPGAEGRQMKLATEGSAARWFLAVLLYLTLDEAIPYIVRDMDPLPFYGVIAAIFVSMLLYEILSLAAARRRRKEFPPKFY